MTVVPKAAPEDILPSPARSASRSRAILEMLLRRFGRDPIHSRMAVNSVWSIIGTAAGQMLMFVTTICAARLLGTGHYGQLGIVVATVNLFTLLGMAGLGTTATKHVAEFRVSNPERAGRIIGLSTIAALGSGLLVAGLLFFLAPYLCVHTLKAPELVTALRIGGGVLLMASLNSSQFGTLAGFEAFRELAVAGAAKGAFTTVAVILLIMWKGVTGAVLGYAIGALLAFPVYQRFVAAKCRQFGIRLSYTSWLSELPLLWKFSIPVLVASMAFTPATWWCNALLANRAGFVQVGIFTAVLQLQTVMLFFSSAISEVVLPVLSNAVPERNISKYKRLLLLNTLTTVGSVVMLAIPLAIFAPLVMSIYGHGFHGGALVLRIICLSAVIGAVNNSVGHAIWSLNAATAGVLLALMRSVVLVIGAYWLIGEGAVGLALAYLILSVIQTSTHVAYIKHLLAKCERNWAVAQAA